MNSKWLKYLQIPVSKFIIPGDFRTDCAPKWQWFAVCILSFYYRWKKKTFKSSSFAFVFFLSRYMSQRIHQTHTYIRIWPTITMDWNETFYKIHREVEIFLTQQQNYQQFFFTIKTKSIRSIELLWIKVRLAKAEHLIITHLCVSAKR